MGSTSLPLRDFDTAVVSTLVGLTVTAANNDDQSKTITFTCPADVAGSLGGTYFTLDYFNINGEFKELAVWFNVDGGNTAPVVAGRINLQVAISSGDDATTVASATASVLNAIREITASSLISGSLSADVTLTGVDAVVDGDAGITVAAPTPITRDVPVIFSFLESEADTIKRHAAAQRPFPVICVTRAWMMYQEDRTQTGSEHPEEDSVETTDIVIGGAEEATTGPVGRTRYEFGAVPMKLTYTIGIYTVNKQHERECHEWVQTKFLRGRPLKAWSAYNDDGSPDGAAVVIGDYDVYTSGDEVEGRSASRNEDIIPGGLTKRALDIVVEADLDLSTPADQKNLSTVLTRIVEFESIQGEKLSVLLPDSEE